MVANLPGGGHPGKTIDQWQFKTLTITAHGPLT